MCVRCAQSTIIDFEYMEDGASWNKIINEKLTVIKDPSSSIPCPMTFMAGYTRPFKSNLTNFSPDIFELWISDPDTLKDMTLHNDNSVNEHCTMGNQDVIYHALIPEPTSSESRDDESPWMGALFS